MDDPALATPKSVNSKCSDSSFERFRKQVCIISPMVSAADELLSEPVLNLTAGASLKMSPFDQKNEQPSIAIFNSPAIRQSPKAGTRSGLLSGRGDYVGADEKTKNMSSNSGVKHATCLNRDEDARQELRRDTRATAFDAAAANHNASPDAQSHMRRTSIFDELSPHRQRMIDDKLEKLVHVSEHSLQLEDIDGEHIVDSQRRYRENEKQDNESKAGRRDVCGTNDRNNARNAYTNAQNVAALRAIQDAVSRGKPTPLATEFFCTSTSINTSGAKDAGHTNLCGLKASSSATNSLLTMECFENIPSSCNAKRIEERSIRDSEKPSIPGALTMECFPDVLPTGTHDASCEKQEKDSAVDSDTNNQPWCPVRVPAPPEIMTRQIRNKYLRDAARALDIEVLWRTQMALAVSEDEEVEEHANGSLDSDARSTRPASAPCHRELAQSERANHMSDSVKPSVAGPQGVNNDDLHHVKAAPRLELACPVDMVAPSPIDALRESQHGVHSDARKKKNTAQMPYDHHATAPRRASLEYHTSQCPARTATQGITTKDQVIISTTPAASPEKAEWSVELDVWLRETFPTPCKPGESSVQSPSSDSSWSTTSEQSPKQDALSVPLMTSGNAALAGVAQAVELPISAGESPMTARCLFNNPETRQLENACRNVSTSVSHTRGQRAAMSPECTKDTCRIASAFVSPHPERPPAMSPEYVSPDSVSQKGHAASSHLCAPITHFYSPEHHTTVRDRTQAEASSQARAPRTSLPAKFPEFQTPKSADNHLPVGAREQKVRSKVVTYPLLSPPQFITPESKEKHCSSVRIDGAVRPHQEFSRRAPPSPKVLTPESKDGYRSSVRQKGVQPSQGSPRLPPSPKFLTPESKDGYRNSVRENETFRPSQESPRRFPPMPKFLTPDSKDGYRNSARADGVLRPFQESPQRLLPTPKFLTPDSKDGYKCRPARGINAVTRWVSTKLAPCHSNSADPVETLGRRSVSPTGKSVETPNFGANTRNAPTATSTPHFGGNSVETRSIDTPDFGICAPTAPVLADTPEFGQFTSESKSVETPNFGSSGPSLAGSTGTPDFGLASAAARPIETPDFGFRAPNAAASADTPGFGQKSTVRLVVSPNNVGKPSIQSTEPTAHFRASPKARQSLAATPMRISAPASPQTPTGQHALSPHQRTSPNMLSQFVPIVGTHGDVGRLVSPTLPPWEQNRQVAYSGGQPQQDNNFYAHGLYVRDTPTRPSVQTRSITAMHAGDARRPSLLPNDSAPRRGFSRTGASLSCFQHLIPSRVSPLQDISRADHPARPLGTTEENQGGIVGDVAQDSAFASAHFKPPDRQPVGSLVPLEPPGSVSRPDYPRQQPAQEEPHQPSVSSVGPRLQHDVFSAHHSERHPQQPLEGSVPRDAPSRSQVPQPLQDVRGADLPTRPVGQLLIKSTHGDDAFNRQPADPVFSPQQEDASSVLLGQMARPSSLEEVTQHISRAPLETPLRDEAARDSAQTHVSGRYRAPPPPNIMNDLLPHVPLPPHSYEPLDIEPAVVETGRHAGQRSTFLAWKRQRDSKPRAKDSSSSHIYSNASLNTPSFEDLGSVDQAHARVSQRSSFVSCESAEGISAPVDVHGAPSADGTASRPSVGSISSVFDADDNDRNGMGTECGGKVEQSAASGSDGENVNGAGDVLHARTSCNGEGAAEEQRLQLPHVVDGDVSSKDEGASQPPGVCADGASVTKEGETRPMDSACVGSEGKGTSQQANIGIRDASVRVTAEEKKPSIDNAADGASTQGETQSQLANVGGDAVVIEREEDPHSIDIGIFDICMQGEKKVPQLDNIRCDASGTDGELGSHLATVSGDGVGVSANNEPRLVNKSSVGACLSGGGETRQGDTSDIRVVVAVKEGLAANGVGSQHANADMAPAPVEGVSQLAQDFNNPTKHGQRDNGKLRNETATSTLMTVMRPIYQSRVSMPQNNNSSNVSPLANVDSFLRLNLPDNDGSLSISAPATIDNHSQISLPDTNDGVSNSAHATIDSHSQMSLSETDDGISACAHATVDCRSRVSMLETEDGGSISAHATIDCRSRVSLPETEDGVSISAYATIDNYSRVSLPDTDDGISACAPATIDSYSRVSLPETDDGVSRFALATVDSFSFASVPDTDDGMSLPETNGGVHNFTRERDDNISVATYIPIDAQTPSRVPQADVSFESAPLLEAGACVGYPSKESDATTFLEFDQGYPNVHEPESRATNARHSKGVTLMSTGCSSMSFTLAEQNPDSACVTLSDGTIRASVVEDVPDMTENQCAPALTNVRAAGGRRVERFSWKEKDPACLSPSEGSISLDPMEASFGNIRTPPHSAKDEGKTDRMGDGGQSDQADHVEEVKQAEVVEAEDFEEVAEEVELEELTQESDKAEDVDEVDEIEFAEDIRGGETEKAYKIDMLEETEGVEQTGEAEETGEEKVKETKKTEEAKEPGREEGTIEGQVGDEWKLGEEKEETKLDETKDAEDVKLPQKTHEGEMLEDTKNAGSGNASSRSRSIAECVPDVSTTSRAENEVVNTENRHGQLHQYHAETNSASSAGALTAHQGQDACVQHPEGHRANHHQADGEFGKVDTGAAHITRDEHGSTSLVILEEEGQPQNSIATASHQYEGGGNVYAFSRSKERQNMNETLSQEGGLHIRNTHERDNSPCSRETTWLENGEGGNESIRYDVGERHSKLPELLVDQRDDDILKRLDDKSDSENMRSDDSQNNIQPTRQHNSNCSNESRGSIGERSSRKPSQRDDEISYGQLESRSFDDGPVPDGQAERRSFCDRTSYAQNDSEASANNGSHRGSRRNSTIETYGSPLNSVSAGSGLRGERSSMIPASPIPSSSPIYQDASRLSIDGTDVRTLDATKSVNCDQSTSQSLRLSVQCGVQTECRGQTAAPQAKKKRAPPKPLNPLVYRKMLPPEFEILPDWTKNEHYSRTKPKMICTRVTAEERRLQLLSYYRALLAKTQERARRNALARSRNASLPLSQKTCAPIGDTRTDRPCGRTSNNSKQNAAASSSVRVIDDKKKATSRQCPGPNAHASQSSTFSSSAQAKNRRRSLSPLRSRTRSACSNGIPSRSSSPNRRIPARSIDVISLSPGPPPSSKKRTLSARTRENPSIPSKRRESQRGSSRAQPPSLSTTNGRADGAASRRKLRPDRHTSQDLRPNNGIKNQSYITVQGAPSVGTSSARCLSSERDSFAKDVAMPQKTLPGCSSRQSHTRFGDDEEANISRDKTHHSSRRLAATSAASPQTTLTGPSLRQSRIRLGQEKANVSTDRPRPFSQGPLVKDVATCQTTLAGSFSRQSRTSFDREEKASIGADRLPHSSQGLLEKDVATRQTTLPGSSRRLQACFGDEETNNSTDRSRQSQTCFVDEKETYIANDNTHDSPHGSPAKCIPERKKTLSESSQRLRTRTGAEEARMAKDKTHHLSHGSPAKGITERKETLPESSQWSRTRSGVEEAGMTRDKARHSSKGLLVKSVSATENTLPESFPRQSHTGLGSEAANMTTGKPRHSSNGLPAKGVAARKKTLSESSQPSPTSFGSKEANFALDTLRHPSLGPLAKGVAADRKSLTESSQSLTSFSLEAETNTAKDKASHSSMGPSAKSVAERKKVQAKSSSHQSRKSFDSNEDTDMTKDAAFPLKVSQECHSSSQKLIPSTGASVRRKSRPNPTTSRPARANLEGPRTPPYRPPSLTKLWQACSASSQSARKPFSPTLLLDDGRVQRFSTNRPMTNAANRNPAIIPHKDTLERMSEGAPKSRPHTLAESDHALRDPSPRRKGGKKDRNSAASHQNSSGVAASSKRQHATSNVGTNRNSCAEVSAKRRKLVNGKASAEKPKSLAVCPGAQLR